MKSLQAVSEKLNQVCARNLGKALFGFFFMALMETITMTVILLPAIPILTSGDDISLAGYIAAGALFFCAVEIWFLFQYGFTSMLLRLVQKKFVTMGFIFMGFKTLKKSLKPTLFLTALCAIVILAFQLASLAFHEELKVFIEKIGFHAFVYVFAALMALVCALILIHFAFLFQISFENESPSFREAVKKNHHLMKGKRFDLVRLMFMGALRPLLVAIIALVLETILASGGEKAPGILSIISLFLSFIYFVNAYTAFIRAYFAIPVLYNSLAHVEVLVEDASDESRLVLEETAALLSDVEEGAGPEEREGALTAGSVPEERDSSLTAGRVPEARNSSLTAGAGPDAPKENPPAGDDDGSSRQ